MLPLIQMIQKERDKRAYLSFGNISTWSIGPICWKSSSICLSDALTLWNKDIIRFSILYQFNLNQYILRTENARKVNWWTEKSEDPINNRNYHTNVISNFTTDLRLVTCMRRGPLATGGGVIVSVFSVSWFTAGTSSISWSPDKTTAIRNYRAVIC